MRSLNKFIGTSELANPTVDYQRPGACSVHD